MVVRIETTPVVNNEADVNRIQRDIESSRDPLEYVQKQDEALSPRFAFGAINNILFPASTTTTFITIPVSYTFSTTVIAKIVSCWQNCSTFV